MTNCPGWVLASAAKTCPLRSVGIPVDPPCTAQELTDIIQATGGRLESLSIPSRVQPLHGRDLGQLLAHSCPNLSCLHANSEGLLPLTRASTSCGTEDHSGPGGAGATLPAARRLK